MKIIYYNKMIKIKKNKMIFRITRIKINTLKKNNSKFKLNMI